MLYPTELRGQKEKKLEESLRFERTTFQLGYIIAKCVKKIFSSEKIFSILLMTRMLYPAELRGQKEKKLEESLRFERTTFI